MNSEDYKEIVSGTTLVGKFVEPSALRGLPENSVDVLLGSDIPVRAYTFVEMLPLPEDAMKGMFYILPDHTSWYLEGDAWTQMYSPEKPTHILVEELPEVEEARGDVEYVLMGDINDASTFKGTFILVDNEWMRTTIEAAYMTVDHLPTAEEGIKDLIYFVYTDPTDPATLEGAYFYSHSADSWQPLDNPQVSFKVEIVEELPEEGDIHTIYLIANEESEGEDVDSYDEYLWINEDWELIGRTRVDLSNYYTKTQVENLLSAKADKADTYTKSEVDGQLATKVPKVDGGNEGQAVGLVSDGAGGTTYGWVDTGGELYDTIGFNTDGAMTQKATTTMIFGPADLSANDPAAHLDISPQKGFEGANSLTTQSIRLGSILTSFMFSGSIGIGSGTSSKGNSYANTAIGMNIGVDGEAWGSESRAVQNTVLIGNYVKGDYDTSHPYADGLFPLQSVAIGYKSNIRNANAIAMGSFSKTTRNEEFSVGNPSEDAEVATRYVANVKDGELATDAATVGQMNTAIAGVQTQVGEFETQIADVETQVNDIQSQIGDIETILEQITRGDIEAENALRNINTGEGV